MRRFCKSSAFLGRMSAGYWWSITRLIELKYNNWPKHIILAFSHWSNDNAIHNGDFYGYVRGDDCTTASFPSTNLEFSSYLLSMLRYLKKAVSPLSNIYTRNIRRKNTKTFRYVFCWFLHCAFDEYNLYGRKRSFSCVQRGYVLAELCWNSDSTPDSHCSIEVLRESV